MAAARLDAMIDDENVHCSLFNYYYYSLFTVTRIEMWCTVQPKSLDDRTVDGDSKSLLVSTEADGS